MYINIDKYTNSFKCTLYFTTMPTDPVKMVRKYGFVLFFSSSIQNLFKQDDNRYVSKPNYDGFVVIGAGLPRTGTASTRSALSILLNGPVYHMFQVFAGGSAEAEFWNGALHQTKSNEEWKQFFEGRGFRGGLDFWSAK